MFQGMSGADQAQSQARTSGPLTPSRPIGGIPATFSEVDSMTDIVLQGLIALRDRLEQGGALRPAPPSGAGEANAKNTLSPSVSGIVGRLRDQQGRLLVAGAVLADISDRIDL